MRYYEVIFTRGIYRTETNSKGKKVKVFLFLSTVTRFYQANEVSARDSEARVWAKVENDNLYKHGWGASVQEIERADMRYENELDRRFRTWCEGIVTNGKTFAG